MPAAPRSHAPVDDLRIHAPAQPGPRAGGDFVLYWMQVTLRAHDNFALNFAVEQANALGVPVLAYHALRPDYPWASDRHHTFIIEAAADLARAFGRRGIQYAFFLERDTAARSGAGESPLVELARRAALVVTDWFPTFIMPRQTRTLRTKVETPVVAVDSACIVPARVHEREHLTVGTFRRDQLAAFEHHLAPVGDAEPRIRTPVDLPFEPEPVAEADVAALVASCAVDHTVTPAPAIRGGASAGRARLDWFLEHALDDYPDGRRDPNRDGTSRLSPYLHFGCLSPQEVLLAVREHASGDARSAFTDECGVWRELAFNFCRHQPRHRTTAATPDWALRELAEHESDERPALFEEPVLDAAATGHPLWDACQRAYVVDGWMHNMLRMIWGKALLMWTPDAAECLRLLEQLNNRYSLDGRDPSTYLNIQWVLGKFDRPFYRRPIYGTVRYMSLDAAAKKFDAAAYIARYAAP